LARAIYLVINAASVSLAEAPKYRGKQLIKDYRFFIEDKILHFVQNNLEWRIFGATVVERHIVIRHSV
jgi:tryptophan 2,3-dioxygenase